MHLGPAEGTTRDATAESGELGGLAVDCLRLTTLRAARALHFALTWAEHWPPEGAHPERAFVSQQGDR
jgi:hypothetical protein